MRVGDIRKLEPDQKNSLAKPLIVMRRASVLCVIQTLGVYCIMLHGTLYVISSMAEQKREEAINT